MARRIERHARPAPKGPLHVDDEMRVRVEGWRRQRMSWADIARNLGRPEPDVRREFGGQA